MFKLLRYVKSRWYFALLAPLCMLGEVSMDFLLITYMEKIVDFGINSSPINVDNIIHYGLIMMGIVFAGVILGILGGVFTTLVAQNFANDLRKDIYKKIMSLSYHQADSFSTSTLITRVTNDIDQVRFMIAMSLRSLVRALSFFVLGIFFTLQISSHFGILLAVMLPLEIAVLGIFISVIFPVYKIIQKRLDRLNLVMHENVSGARVIKAFNQEDYENNRFQKANQDYTDITLKVARISALLTPLLNIIIFITQVLIYYYGGSTIIDFFNLGSQFTGDMVKIGEISQAVTYINMISMSIMILGTTFLNFARAYASSSRINEVLDSSLEIQDGTKDLKETTEHGTISYQDVSFKYDGAKQPVFSHINFEVKQGETIAIVGATGCGKSSLVNLLPRFYDVTQGKILVDGHDVKEYRLKDLRDKISLCLQKSELFKGTIKENILWGKPDADDKEIRQALDIAQASEFVFQKEAGMDEYIEEKGASLSGGQKQRLSIARAVIKKPEIIIFDDSTSALDLLTEARLHASLKEYLPETTKIIVAQRIATAKNANRIMVLDQGQIVAFDKHENLIKNCSVYLDIYNSQLKDEDKIYE
ncbi:MAG: ABC transporter ATP-binding protein/permease [Bacilli bacterium]|nr:ABC transporter ATP-binding protein/permease [Bacilli bacterium]